MIVRDAGNLKKFASASSAVLLTAACTGLQLSRFGPPYPGMAAWMWRIRAAERVRGSHWHSLAVMVLNHLTHDSD